MGEAPPWSAFRAFSPSELAVRCPLLMTTSRCMKALVVMASGSRSVPRFAGVWALGVSGVAAAGVPPRGELAAGR